MKILFQSQQFQCQKHTPKVVFQDLGKRAWQASFPGTEIRDDTGEVRFRVARGRATNAHEVDGITGATRTGNGVTRMMRFWLGPDGYGPLLDAIERGEF